MIKKIFFGIIFCFLVTISFSQEETLEEVKLYVGETKVFSVDKPQRVVIGKPEIADVSSVSEKEITLVAKSAGQTNFIFWDRFGEQAFRIKVFPEDLQPIKERIDNLIKELNLNKVYTKPQEEEGKILLLGEVRTFEDKERLFTTLGALKEKTIDLIKVREEKLVEIDVQVLELTKEASEELGFSWPGNLTITEQNYPTESSPTKFSTLFRVKYFSRSNFLWTIDFLQRQRKLNILSRPRLVCLSGKEAELLVGGEVPTFTATVSATGTTTGEVEYKEYGIKLKIRPTVTENDKIQLSLNTEVSEIGEVETTSYARAYPLTKRSASTELYLDNGETIAIGGLIKQKSDVNVQKVPWLAEVPVLGLFFRHKSIPEGSPQQDTELFITITPTIIKGKEVSLEKIEEKKPPIEVNPIEETSLLPKDLRNYINGVQNKISRYVQYPPQAKGTGWYGTVKLGLLVSGNGNLKDIEVIQSSGYNLLDEAAKLAVKKASPFPPIPKELNLNELRIEIPITYNEG